MWIGLHSDGDKGGSWKSRWGQEAVHGKYQATYHLTDTM
jgi:hypothetical protein